MDINWNVSQLDSKTSDGFVTTAHWQCTAVDEDYSASVYAACSWSEGEPVIAYNSLTKEQVLSWIWESVDKEATEAAVAAQIEAQKNPVTVTGVPW